MKLFLIVTFLWSWGLFLAASVSGIVKVPFQDNDANAVLFLIVFMCGPMIGAIVAALKDGAFFRVLRLTGRPNMWWLRSWTFPVAVVLIAMAIAIMIPGVVLSRPQSLLDGLPPEQRAALPQSGLVLDLMIIAQALVVGSLVNSVALLNEELGWRGYMLSRLSGLGFWSRHGLIGLVWGIWHVPVVYAGHNYPGEPLLGPLVFTGYCLLLSPVIGYFSEKSGSVFGATIFHGTLNAAAPLSVLLLSNVGVFERGVIGWPGMVVLAAACIWIWIRHLDASADQPAG